MELDNDLGILGYAYDGFPYDDDYYPSGRLQCDDNWYFSEHAVNAL